MKNLKIFIFVSIVFTLSIGVVSCKKEEVLKDAGASVSLSTDTIFFDTVFAGVGSITKQFKIFNPYDEKIIISSVFLAGGQNSYFRMNVNGTPGAMVKEIELEGKDSLFVFIEFKAPVINQNTPYIITDSVGFSLNGNTKWLQLLAYGQDAHFIKADNFIDGLPPFKIIAHEGEVVTWTNDKPYVITGYAVIDSTAKLIIEEGCRIYFHKGAGLWVYKGGSIKVNGTLQQPVTFQSDRTDEYYKDLADQWDRIWINEGSVDNEFNYAIIKNGFIGIQAETMQQNMGNKLILNNTIIKNMSGAGILTRYYKIDSYNTVVANCGQSLLALTLGGEYNFTHCTFANYWSGSVRQTASLILNNYNQIQSLPLQNTNFTNCILYGVNENEITIDKSTSTEIFKYKFENCLLKTSLNTASSEFINCLKNVNPEFKDESKFEFWLNSTSPAINKAKLEAAQLFPNDLKGKSRIADNTPDIGAYEYYAE